MSKGVVAVLGLLLCVGCSDQSSLEGSGSLGKDLIVASAGGDRAAVVRLLDAGADVNFQLGTVERPVTPLLVALAKKQFGVAEELVRRGASLDVRYDGISPYAFALWLKGGDSELLKAMEEGR